MTYLKINRFTKKHYEQLHATFRGINLSITEVEFGSLLDASGCGKSTLLRTIAVLEIRNGPEVLN